MKKSWLWLGVGLVLLGPTSAGAAGFSRSLPPSSFAEAGLTKLTPQELARLDELVAARLHEQVDQTRKEADQRVAAEVQRVKSEADRRVETAIATAEKKASSESLLHRMRVVLTPGTQVDYATIESKLAGPFYGYEPGTELTLENGQRWQVLEGKYWSPKREAHQERKVVVRPGVLGSFYIDIEGAGSARVSLRSSGT